MDKKVDWKQRYDNYVKRKQKEEKSLRDLLSTQSDELFGLHKKLNEKIQSEKGKYFIKLKSQNLSNCDRVDAINWLQQNLIGVKVDRESKKDIIDIPEQIFRFDTLAEANSKAIRLLNAKLWFFKVDKK